MWLVPAVLGAFWMSRSRRGGSRWDMLDHLRRERSYHRRPSRGGFAQMLINSLFGRKRGRPLFG